MSHLDQLEEAPERIEPHIEIQRSVENLNRILERLRGLLNKIHGNPEEALIGKANTSPDQLESLANVLRTTPTEIAQFKESAKDLICQIDNSLYN